MTIEELDKNMAFGGIKHQKYRFYDRYTPGFEFDGCVDLKNFGRIDMEKDLPELPEGIREGCRCTGITLRFRTDSSAIALKGVLWVRPFMPIMALTGSHGFDLYLASGTKDGHVAKRPQYINPFRPDINDPMIVSGEWELRPYMHPSVWHDVEIGFPLYNGVTELEIGLDEWARILPPAPLADTKPILFYGSSITQGAAASRPGNSYTSMVARTLRMPQRNLGYSGRAKGEPEMARYIARQDMRVFVMDYDHNADNTEYLAQTHEPFYRTVREAQPDLPIVMMTRPNYDINPSEAEANFKVIEATYRHALEAGDRHVYLVDNRSVFFGDQRDNCTVDSCHPNDLGFYRMYRRVLPVIRQAIREDIRK